jgi:hypothetical protein
MVEACLSEVGGVVVDVSHHKASLLWQLLDQRRSYLIVCCVGGLEHFHQMAPQAADLLGKPLGQSLQPPLEGAPRGEAALLTKEFAHDFHLGGRFVEDRQELSHSMQPSLMIMITRAFKKSFSG